MREGRNKTMFIISRIGILIVFVLFPILRYVNTPPADRRKHSDEVWDRMQEFYVKHDERYKAHDLTGMEKAREERLAYVRRLDAEGTIPTWLKNAYAEELKEK